MKKKLLIFLFAMSIFTPNALFLALKDHLDTENHENRALAEFPSLDFETIFQFPIKFENYYNDHMPFKNYFVRLNNKIDTKLFRNTSVGDVTIGKDNWLFYTVSKDGENALADYQRTNLYTEEASKRIADKIKAVSDYLMASGVKSFHYYVAPSKETVYPEYMPESVKVYDQKESRIQHFAAYMKSRPEISFTYLYEELLPYKADYQLYYKYDTHLNNLGSFLLSCKMAGDLTGTSPSLSQVQLEEGPVFIGDMSRMLNQEAAMADDHDVEIVNFYPEVHTDLINEIAGEEEILREFVSDSPNNRTLLLIGDSYRLRVEPFLSKLYSHMVVVHIDEFTPDMIGNYQPDDVAVITVERNQKYMENLDQYFGLEELQNN